MKHKLYLWNNYHNGDIITTIPLIWEIYNQINDVEVAIGCFKNHAYLFRDTPISSLHVYPEDDISPVNLSHMCPEGYVNIHTWLGQYSDTQAHNWTNQVKVFNRKCKEKGLSIQLISNIVPGIFFPYTKLNVPIHNKMVWVENGLCRSGHSKFYFDMDKIGSLFSDMFFYTTAAPNSSLSNVINCSSMNLIELSNLSNQCDIILGKGSGPYLATFTNINKYKPRAVVGFNLKTHLAFWDYPNSPLQYLEDEDSLISYLRNLNQ
jgi:hypothetical protein